MSYHDAYLPSIRREEAYDEALEAKEAELWESALSPVVADELALHSEVGADSLGPLLCLAAYANTTGGRHDTAWIASRLVELFQHDIERVARYEVSKEF